MKGKICLGIGLGEKFKQPGSRTHLIKYWKWRFIDLYYVLSSLIPCCMGVKKFAPCKYSKGVGSCQKPTNNKGKCEVLKVLVFIQLFVLFPSPIDLGISN